MSSLSDRLLAWFECNGRHDLPWQKNSNAYRVWVSEIMLQQTQVVTVIPYFERFMDRFPSVHQLAAANIDEVLHHWSGLGYYARSRNLHRAANIIVDDYAGELPRDLELLIALPGIGRSTAGAILALAHGDRHPILDGNVKRVLARYHEVNGSTGDTQIQKELWAYAEMHTPNENVRAYTQAIMDLGATLCVRTKPRCECCPLSHSCLAFAHQSQARYPAPRKRKALPTKTTTFIVARRDDSSVLLWRRPPSGIWGGLWGFPEIDSAEDIETWCARRRLAQIGPAVRRPEILHTFTHFRLKITPLEIGVEQAGAQVMDSHQWLWYNNDAPVNIGLAKPVSQLLKTDYSEHQEDTM